MVQGIPKVGASCGCPRHVLCKWKKNKIKKKKVIAQCYDRFNFSRHVRAY